jgi:hypothetical protein
VSDHGDGRIEYSFYERVSKMTAPGLRPQYAAKLEIERSPSASPRACTDAFSIEAFQARSHAVIEAEQFLQEDA